MTTWRGSSVPGRRARQQRRVEQEVDVGDERDPCALWRRQDLLEPARGVEAAEAAAGDRRCSRPCGAYLSGRARGALLRPRAPGARAACSRRRTRHGAPANAWLATVAKPCSSVRSASSRWAIRSDGGSSSPLGRRRRSSGRRARRARRAARRARRPARRPASPRSMRQPGRALQLARVVAEQVAEQALRDRLGVARCGRRAACTVLAPRTAYRPGMIQACASAIAPTGADSGSISNRTTATTQNGTTCATIVSVHSRARMRSVRVGLAAAPGDGRRAREARPRTPGSGLSRRRSGGA